MINCIRFGPASEPEENHLFTQENACRPKNGTSAESDRTRTLQTKLRTRSVHSSRRRASARFRAFSSYFEEWFVSAPNVPPRHLGQKSCRRRRAEPQQSPGALLLQK